MCKSSLPALRAFRITTFSIFTTGLQFTYFLLEASLIQCVTNRRNLYALEFPFIGNQEGILGIYYIIFYL